MRAWEQFLSHLEQKLGPEAVEQWLRPLKVARFDAGNLYLEAVDSFHCNWFEEHARPHLKDHLLNNNQRPIKVHLSHPNSKRTEPQQEPARAFSISPSGLDPEMALENFIPSPENLMAYKLLSEIPSPFNPIYLYGPKGSGKTHLLTGVALALKKSGKRVFFVRAEAFTEHVVQAMRLGHMQDFRKIYREIDVLIVDDVHIFSRKTATQEEFFHTFNTLHTVGKPILLSAQTAPSQLVDIEPRLMSRFEWGISLGLERPDVSLILEKKASLWKVSLSPEIKDLLLKKFPRHPLLALQALSLRSKEKGVMTCELAERLLSDLLAKEEREALTPEKIIKAVAAHYGVRSEDLLGKSQMKEYVLPRQIAMYLCREHLKWPFQKIGQLFGRDHSTVMSSAKQVQKGIEKNTLEAILSIASLEKS